MKLFLATGLLFFTFASHAQTALELKGKVEGYQTRNYDNYVDFGLVIPLQSRSELLNFNVASVLSSKTDTIRAAGQALNIPSNISLPSQRERFFITIRMNKPAYRLTLDGSTLPSNLGVLEGRFPFRETVNTLRSGAPLFSVLNSFKFRSYSTQAVESENLDLEVGQNPVDGETYEISAPQPEDSSYITLGINLTEVEEDQYFPIDLKIVGNRPLSFKTDGQENTPVFAHIPKSAVSNSMEEALKKPFPFSLVWGEAQPTKMLPLAASFVEFSEGFLYVDQDSLSEDFSVIGYRLSLLDSDKELLYSELLTDSLETEIEVPDLDETSRVRLDVFALDLNFFVQDLLRHSMSPDELSEVAKYVSRYEVDLN